MVLFITFLKIIPGKYTKAIKILKNPRLPPKVKILQSLWLLGKPDAVFLFEAPDEATAGEFIIQFGEVTEIQTSVVFPIEKMRWLP